MCSKHTKDGGEFHIVREMVIKKKNNWYKINLFKWPSYEMY